MRTLVLAWFLLGSAPLVSEAKPPPTFMLVMHGGAGTLSRADMTPALEQAHRDAVEQALRAGHAILVRGGSSVDAVEAGVRVLEDSPLYNAGKGAAFTHEGRNELDA